MRRKSGAPGELHGNTYRTVAEIREIRRLHAEGARATDLAEKYNMTSAGIRHIVRRRTWKHVP